MRPADIQGKVRLAAAWNAAAALAMLTAAAAWPLHAQSATPGEDAASSQSSVPGLTAPAAIPKLPSGFFIQDATIFSSALFASLPGSPGGLAGSPFSANGWQTGLGLSVDAGWTKVTPLNTFSVVSSSSLTEYQRAAHGRNWNEYLNASVKRLMSPRLRSEVFAHLVITDQQQFLFGETQGTFLAIPSGTVITPAASNLLLVERNLLASGGGQVWYDYSPRTTLSLEAEVVRNQAIGSGGETASSGAFSSLSESATGTVAHTLSRRSEVDFSLAAVRTASPLDTSLYASTLAAYSYALGDAWFARVHAGISVGSSSSGSAGISNPVSFSGILNSSSPKAQPIGGASLEYRRKASSFLLSTNRGVTEIYGAGAAIVWSSNATWNMEPSRSHWNFFLGTGYDLSSSGAQERIDGWRGNSGISRFLSRHWSASFQYAFLSNASRYPGAMQSLHSHGLRLALVWTPAGK